MEDFGSDRAQEVYSVLGGYQTEEEANRGKSFQAFQTAEPNNIDYVGFDCSFDHENCFKNGDQLSRNQQSFLEPEIGCVDMGFTPFSHPVKKERVNPISLASLKLLKNYSAGNKLNNLRKLNDWKNEKLPPNVGARVLSTEEVIRVAGTRYIQICDHKEGDPFRSMLPSLTDEDYKDVELVHSLLASAEKIGSGFYDRASRMLLQCEYLSSNTGNPVQRLVYYVADALRERIDREMGRISSKESNKLEGIEEEMIGTHPSILAFHQALPFAKVLQFTQIQIILDAVGSSRKIHLIDLAIRTGMHWTVLMQALSVRPGPQLELLTITAVGMSREKISESGKRLVAFAETLNIPFSFKMIVSDMELIKEEMFGVGGSESLAVYSQTVLRNMISRPSCLEHLMKVIRNLNPLVMTVGEVEANHNSPSFVDRFIEVLFFYGAYFDAVDACMDRVSKDRLALEATFWASGIRNMVAMEGSERLVRHVEIDVWRSFITRFGFAEVELSQVCMDQAGLIVNQHAFGSFFTLGKKGQALTIGWKGTPLHSVSAWKCC